MQTFLVLAEIHPSALSRAGDFKLSLGDQGCRIESLTILIPSRPNSIVDYATNLIPSRRSSQQTYFRCNFDLLLIKIDQF